MKKLIFEIKYRKELFAMIIREKRRFIKKGVDFISKSSDLLQIGFLKDRILVFLMRLLLVGEIHLIILKRILTLQLYLVMMPYK